MDNKILKRSKTLLVLLFLFLMVTLVQAEENIAVFPFGNKVEQDYNLTELAENEMTSLLVNQKRFDVIERKELNKILEEQHLSNSGIVDINQALQIGKIKGIRYGVFGQITNVSYTNKDLALVTLQLKIVDMETANIVFSKVYNARPKDEKNDNKETVLTNVLKEKFKKEISNDLINTFTIEGSVVDINGKKIAIDIGSKQGVVKGMEFNVIEKQEKVSKNDKKVKIEKAKALLEVVEVFDETSICKFKDGEKIEEGMDVKLVQLDENRYYKAEDIEKILARRGIQKGDLLISAYGGGGGSMNYEPMDNGFKKNRDFISYGISGIIFVRTYFGIGVDFFVINTVKDSSFGGETSTGYGWYEHVKLNTKNIALTGRLNLNNSSCRVYIPLGIGFSNLSKEAQLAEDDYEQFEYKKVDKTSILYYFGLGIEFNITNNFFIGIEGRGHLIDKSYFLTGLLKLDYRFEELIKL